MTLMFFLNLWCSFALFTMAGLFLCQVPRQLFEEGILWPLQIKSVEGCQAFVVASCIFLWWFFLPALVVDVIGTKTK